MADVAIRIQLSASAYGEAIKRHEAIKSRIERPDSPLHGLVELFYPQGSMATGSTIASRLRTDEFDIDIVSALLLSADTRPDELLDLLYRAIRGQDGSRYSGMTERRTRCVTVHYADNMHLDVTPMVRRHETPERESWLFHHHEGTPPHQGTRLIANPYGFALWFNAKTPLDHAFSEQYSARAREYDLTLLRGTIDDDPIPPLESPGRKSKAVIVLQLLKRWRNVQYDSRQGRRPPSILLSKLIAENAGKTQTLSEELLHQARQILTEFERWHNLGMLIRVANPVCTEDVLTDRWPASKMEQAQFVHDLRGLVEDVEHLVAGCPLDKMREILTRLFGEQPTGAAINAYAERQGAAIQDGTSRQYPGSGRIVIPATAATPALALATPVRTTPKHRFYGDYWERRA